LSASTWSWLAAVVSIVGLWIAGYNPRTGWIYGIASQAVWITYGLTTNQPGMIALSVAFVTIYLRNLWRWRGRRFERVVQHRPEPSTEQVGTR
jgi:hypothetical protein